MKKKNYYRDVRVREGMIAEIDQLYRIAFAHGDARTATRLMFARRALINNNMSKKLIKSTRATIDKHNNLLQR